MVKTENENKSTNVESSDEASSLKNKQKHQGKKRKRSSSESSNDEMILPDNALETERSVHASAVKNNLDETSVRKIIKRVVTNDHVLALVQLREEEENSSANDKKLQPKLTRAKVKELKKVSPKCTAWNLDNLELTPINHIPVKTRPEVKALIAQELPEDEDDEEYEPTHDDVPSDDEHTESCSDLDSQPRTPATPASLHADSPRVVKDGPFKVPLDVSSARRKLDVEEEATIALRTRSKLSLSATSIEHIESTFVPPDDLPIQDVDDLWNQFLNECLNPASTIKHEEDDEADPEYNVAADDDTHDEDDDSLKSLFKISKKELNDLVTELFNIMPEANDENLAENLANSVLTNNSQTEIPRWEGKQELLSDDENGEKPSKTLTFENDGCSLVSLGKNVPEDLQDKGYQSCADKERKKEKGKEQSEKGTAPKRSKKSTEIKSSPRIAISNKNNKIDISIEELNTQASVGPEAPPSLRSKIKPALLNTLHIEIDPTDTMTPEQLLILQQQIRQHVQLATSNFMQLVVHPIHWKYAPTYKEYLTSLTKLVEANESSAVNVCNLKPAYELITMWENSVSSDTAENRKMIEFIQSEVERSRRRMAGNSLYVGEFHETFKKVVCNSPVFLYPYLLPGMPYRPDATRRFCYLHSEDVLIVLGLEQFWQYVDSNPQLYKPARVAAPRGRRGLMAAVELVTKHMFPWMSARTLAGHVHAARAARDAHNPIYRFFKLNEVPKTEHRILPYNTKLTLYEQPEHEMPKIWVRYLAKTSKRFRNYLHKRPNANGRQPDGVLIDPGLAPTTTVKRPLPIDFTKEIISSRSTLNDKPLQPNLTDKYDIKIQSLATDNQTDTSNPIANIAPAENSTLVVQNFYTLVETSTGAYLLPLQVNTQTVNSNMGSITTPVALNTVTNNIPETLPKRVTYNTEHCMCCVLLRQICKKRQTYITEYFKSKAEKRICDCNSIKYPAISDRLRLLVRNNKKMSELVFKELERKLKDGADSDAKTEINDFDSKDMAYVLGYQLKVFTRASMSRRIYVKKRVSNLLSHFDIDSGDPIKLALDLFKAFDVELVDLYLDFLGFLTPEQADKLEVFRDYFTRNCAKGLMRKVEEQVSNKGARHRILSQLKQVVSDNKSSSCELCRGLLDTMRGQPALARYTFHLFPHRKETRTQMCTSTVEPPKCAEAQKDANDTTRDEPHNTVDYEADHSSCGEDSDAMSEDLTIPHNFGGTHETTIKTELPPEGQEDPFADISKAEADECDSDTSMATYETGSIKFEEICDWKREEDKIVLQVLQEQLTPEERKEISIVELFEQKNVYTIISESLTERSLEQIKDRVMYLLSMLLVNENS